MTTHELAKALLEMPNVLVEVAGRIEYPIPSEPLPLVHANYTAKWDTMLPVRGGCIQLLGADGK